MTDGIERRTQELGESLLRDAQKAQEAFYDQHRAEMSLLDWCMRSEDLRTRVFRFIDVFPSLKNSAQVVRHLQEYFPNTDHRLPAGLRAALFLTRPSLLTRGAVQKVTQMLYRRVAALFIGAANPEEAAKKLQSFAQQGLNLSIDLLGEKTISEKEAGDYEARYADLIRALGTLDLGCEKQNVSVKLSALDPRFNVIDPRGTSRRVRERLSPLLDLARTHKVFLHIDMEDYESRDLTLKIVKDLLEEETFRSGVSIGIVLQAYLRDAENCYDSLLPWMRELSEPLTIRLVRGAYWDTELMRAEAQHWPAPVFTHKEETNRMFEHLTERITREIPQVKLAVATHNIRSIAYAMALAEARNIPKSHMEFQVLYGMGASLMEPLRNAGWTPRVYMPIGEPVTGMAYLVRRLLENVSSQSFIRRLSGSESPASELQAAPEPPPSAVLPQPSAQQTLSYRPTALLQFHDETVRSRFQRALDEGEAEFGGRIPAVINGRKHSSKTVLKSVSPIDGETLIAEVSQASSREAEEAVIAADRCFSSWAGTPVKERAACLRRAAEWMLQRRYELAALEVYEAGKTWREADGDVVEAMDFLNFYAFHAERLMRETPTELLTQETNLLYPQSRGVCAVIAPWNFPIAILTGMSAAALVAGNPVVLKPAEQSLACGWKLFQAYRAAGIPEGVVHFLPGIGEEVGRVLVSHPKTALIAFTGSKEVGLEILRNASEIREGSGAIKRCITELGGKNAMIVDSTADFDSAVPAVLQSAFGFAGQKCSALSRLILLEDIYEPFICRLAEAAGSFHVTTPADAAALCGPVISREAKERIDEVIKRGESEGKTVFRGNLSGNLSGYYVPPVIFTDLPDDSDLLKKEIFGPVLIIRKAKKFSGALELANQSEYALTGGVFSRTPSHIEQAKRHFAAGNLYINRSITGAIVGRQPFGGYKLSGGGTKAGSADYLREFFFYRTVTEDVSRHGFAPGRQS